MHKRDSIDLQEKILIEQGKDNEYDFFLSKLDAKTIIEYSNIIRLNDNPEEGVQRFLDKKRVKSIEDYCKSENVLFPTPIILTLNSDFIKDKNTKNVENGISINISDDMIEDLGKPFSIIDGQHRIEGIKQFYENNPEDRKEFNLPIIVYLDADQSKAARIFVTINANQRSVDDSTIHELFGIIYRDSDKYTVQSFSNQVAKVLNETPYNPFYNGIKMLGRKQTEKQFISQGTIVKKITERITNNIDRDNLRIEKGKGLEKNDKKIFRDFFIDNDPLIVAKIMINFFDPFSRIFSSIWQHKPGYITKKAIGFSTLMKLLDYIYLNTDNLTKDDFTAYFEKLKKYRGTEVEDLFKSSDSSESVANRISKELINIFKEENIINTK